MTKHSMRSELKAERSAFAARHPGFLSAASIEAMPIHLAEWLAAATCVAGYVPIQHEADPLRLLRRLGQSGHMIALPHITARDAPMRFLEWIPDSPLIAGPMGLTQPPTDASEATPDVIITPLVGFDRRLHRIGYGAGFYDRAFALFPHARRIGLAWSVQEVDAVPNDSWDVTLDAVWTEREWIFNGDRQT